MNPASGTFAWLGIENAEVVLLNDFRWKPSLIPWCELLQVLEGDTVHFPAPKNVMNKDIVLDKDTPFFATSDAPLALIKGGSIDRINTEMMQVTDGTPFSCIGKYHKTNRRRLKHVIHVLRNLS